MSNYILFILMMYILVFALIKKVDAYQAFIEGCCECLKIFFNIYPSLIAIILLVRFIEYSNILDIFDYFITPNFKELFLMSIFRPISGNASLALLIRIFEKYGADSLIGVMGSVIQGATDTTFYVIALYFGSINVKKIGNTVAISLFADIMAMGLGIYFVLNFF